MRSVGFVACLFFGAVLICASPALADIAADNGGGGGVEDPVFFGRYQLQDVASFGGLGLTQCQDPSSVYGFAYGSDLEISRFPDPFQNGDPCVPPPRDDSSHDHDHLALLKQRQAFISQDHDHDHAHGDDNDILVRPTACHSTAWSRLPAPLAGLWKQCGGTSNQEFEILLARADDHDDHEHFSIAALGHDHGHGPEGLLRLNVTHRASGQGCAYLFQDERHVPQRPKSFPLNGRWRPLTVATLPQEHEEQRHDHEEELFQIHGPARGGMDPQLCNDSSQVFGFLFGSDLTVSSHWRDDDLHYEPSLDQCANHPFNASRHAEGLLWKSCGPAEIRYQTQANHSQLLAVVERLANRSQACEFTYERHDPPAPTPVAPDTRAMRGRFRAIPGSEAATGALTLEYCRNQALPWGFAYGAVLSVSGQGGVIPSICYSQGWGLVEESTGANGTLQVLRKDCGDVRTDLFLEQDGHDGHGDHGQDEEHEHDSRVLLLRVSRLTQPADTCSFRFAAESPQGHDHQSTERWEAYLYTILATLGAALVSLVGVLFLAFGVRTLLDWVDELLALSAGTLLGSACFSLLPEVNHTVGFDAMAGFVILLGILFGLLSEKLVHVHIHTGLHSGHSDRQAAREATGTEQDCRVCVELCPHECVDDDGEAGGQSNRDADASVDSGMDSLEDGSRAVVPSKGPLAMLPSARAVSYGSNGFLDESASSPVPPSSSSVGKAASMLPEGSSDSHGHRPEHKHQRMHLAITNLIGDLIHNLIDGALIGAAFVESTSLGLTVSLAILLHELPQEMGDFGVLLHAGFSKTQALALNFAVSMVGVMGGVIAVAIGHELSEVHYLIPFCCGLFLYLSLCALLPELMSHVNDTSDEEPGHGEHDDGDGHGGHRHHSHRHGLTPKQRKALRIVFWVVVGMGLMALLLLLPEESHSHTN